MDTRELQRKYREEAVQHEEVLSTKSQCLSQSKVHAGCSSLTSIFNCLVLKHLIQRNADLLKSF